MAAPVNKGLNDISFSFKPKLIVTLFILTAFVFLLFAIIIFLPFSKKAPFCNVDLSPLT